MEYHIYSSHHLNKSLLEFMHVFSIFHGNISHQEFWFIVYVKKIEKEKYFPGGLFILLLANALEIENEVNMYICLT